MSEQEQTIDLRVLLKVLTEHLIPIIIATFLAAAIGFSLAAFIIPKTYTSSALMYVENSSSKQEDTAVNVNDISAAGIIRSIHEHNLRIPQDISVISFGNTYLSSLLNPSLTTVGCNFRTFGGEIIKTALSLIKKEPVQKEILIEPSLTKRNSCIGQ